MERLCLQKINYLNYTPYIMKIKGLSMEDLCGDTTFSKTYLRKYFFSLVTKVCVRETTIISTFLNLQNFPIL